MFCHTMLLARKLKTHSTFLLWAHKDIYIHARIPTYKGTNAACETGHPRT